jgi:hypothetical protein
VSLIKCENRRNAIANGGRLKGVLQGALQRLATPAQYRCIASKFAQSLASFVAKQPPMPMKVYRNATNRARSFSPACKPQVLQTN